MGYQLLGVSAADEKLDIAKVVELGLIFQTVLYDLYNQ